MPCLILNGSLILLNVYETLIAKSPITRWVSRVLPLSISFSKACVLFTAVRRTKAAIFSTESQLVLQSGWEISTGDDKAADYIEHRIYTSIYRN